MDQKILKVLTILMAIGLIGYFVFLTVQKQLQPTAAVKPRRPASTTTEAANKRRALEELALGSFASINTPDPATSLLRGKSSATTAQRGDLSLRVGVIGATPDRREVTTLDELPHTDSSIRRAYVDARDRTCRLLVPGVAVSPPLNKPRLLRAGSLGRMTVLTIGLEFDSTEPKKLPAVTRGQVNKYFADHRLAVQPVIYHDAEGRPYFGTDCQAAFFEMQRPGTTVKAEPMINIAISRFRALGVVADAEGVVASRSDIFGRTLALAFTFAKKDTTITGAGDSTKTTMELLLLHLTPDCSAEEPEIQIFVTSDERTNLHRLETRGMRLNSPTPTISADIQFNKTVLMGMYPADPIVSGIRYRSAGILAMETIRRLGEDGGDGSAISLTEILDQFGKLAGGGTL